MLTIQHYDKYNIYISVIQHSTGKLKKKLKTLQSSNFFTGRQEKNCSINRSVDSTVEIKCTNKSYGSKRIAENLTNYVD